MFIRDHLYYYALSLFFIVLSFFVHKIFFIVCVIFSVYFIYKTSFAEVFIFYLICICILIFNTTGNKIFYEKIEGTVISYNENSSIIKCDHSIVKVYHDYDLRYKDEVSMYVSKLDINDQRNDNGFNEYLYFKANNIDWKAKCIKLINVNDRYCFVDFVEDRISKNPFVKSYQRLFLLGVKDEMIEDQYNNLLDLSIVHLFALSGMHLYFLKRIIDFVLSFFISKNNIDILSYFILFAYIINIPFSISLSRAFFMMVLYKYLSKYFNKLDIFCMIFIIFLLYNPYYIYNYSFVFSFGIYLFVLLTQDIKYNNFYVYVLSLPLLILYQNRLHVTSFLFSSVLGLFVEFFYVLIIFSMFFSPLNIILEFLIEILNNMIIFVSSIDKFLVFAKPELSFFILYYIISFSLIMKRQLKIKSSKEHCLLIALIIACFIHGRYSLYASVTMIDVGQGDCTLIRLPMNKGNILIDTGGNIEYDIAKSVLIPYFYSIGISSLDYVYISHDDLDHSGALESLCNNFDVKCVINEFEEKRIINDLSIEMLKTDKVYKDKNNNSLLMKLSLCDLNFLFMGDAGIEVEKDLYEKYGEMDIDVLKVSHHGSSTSSSPFLFKMIHPSVAMIGVGRNNIYNHPSNQVIERLKRKGITILRTDEDGMFHIRIYFKNCYIFR